MQAGAPNIYVVPASFGSRLWWLLRTSFLSAWEDNCFAIAKGAAYSSLLAFLPVLTASAAILVQANAGEVSRIISGWLFEVVPPGTEDLVEKNFTSAGNKPATLLIFAVTFAVWAASGTMMSLMEGFQSIYRLPSGRGIIRQRLVAIFLVFVAAIPVVTASSLILFGNRTEQEVSQWLGFLPEGSELQGWLAQLSEIARFLIATGAIVSVTVLLYFFGPNRKQRFRRLWAGALLATFLWLVATTIFAWYVRNIANYNVLYGSIGAGIALLVWMYVMAVVALIGCECNAILERSSMG